MELTEFWLQKCHLTLRPHWKLLKLQNMEYGLRISPEKNGSNTVINIFETIFVSSIFLCYLHFLSVIFILLFFYNNKKVYLRIL